MSTSVLACTPISQDFVESVGPVFARRRRFRPDMPSSRVSLRAWTPRTQRGQSWSVSVQLTDAQRRMLSAWQTPGAWLKGLHAALRAASHNGSSIRVPEGKKWDKGCVTIKTILAVARVDAATADRRTGRNVRTANRTVGRRLGCSSRTVQRARIVIESLGFSVTVARGRILSPAEREEARKTHGRTQWHVASTRYLTEPRPAHAPVGDPSIGALPRRGTSCSQSSVSRYSPTRASARAGAASRQAPTTTNRRRRRASSRPVHHLADGLQQLLPYLTGWNNPAVDPTDHRDRFGALCHTLRMCGLYDADWTTQDVYQLLNGRLQARGLCPIPASHQRDPLALLAHCLRDALTRRGDQPTPGAARREAEQRRALEARRREAERAALDAQRAAEHRDPQVQASHRARMATLRAHLRQITQPTHYGPELPQPASRPAALRTRLMDQP